jgi:FRG domain
MAIRTEKIRSVGDYLKLFHEIISGWSGPRGEIRPWARGQSDADWRLIPGEYRGGPLNPDELRSEFQLRALPFLTQVPRSEWEWYFLMQHYGLPTRLLDWTTGSLLGLYFALRERAGEADAAVWIMDPWALNKRSTGKPELLLASDPAARPYLPRLFDKRAKLPSAPVAVVPPYNSTRITAQRGAFTIHGSERRGLEELLADRLVRAVVPKDRAMEIKRALRRAGIAEFTVFPELDGLCGEINAAEVEGC